MSRELTCNEVLGKEGEGERPRDAPTVRRLTQTPQTSQSQPFRPAYQPPVTRYTAVQRPTPPGVRPAFTLANPTANRMFSPGGSNTTTSTASTQSYMTATRTTYTATNVPTAIGSKPMYRVLNPEQAAAHAAAQAQTQAAHAAALQQSMQAAFLPGSNVVRPLATRGDARPTPSSSAHPTPQQLLVASQQRLQAAQLTQAQSPYHHPKTPLGSTTQNAPPSNAIAHQSSIQQALRQQFQHQQNAYQQQIQAMRQSQLAASQQNQAQQQAINMIAAGNLRLQQQVQQQQAQQRQNDQHAQQRPHTAVPPISHTPALMLPPIKPNEPVRNSISSSMFKNSLQASNHQMMSSSINRSADNSIAAQQQMFMNRYGGMANGEMKTPSAVPVLKQSTVVPSSPLSSLPAHLQRPVPTTPLSQNIHQLQSGLSPAGHSGITTTTISTPSPRPSILRKRTDPSTPGTAKRKLPFDDDKPSTSAANNSSLTDMSPDVRSLIQTANSSTAQIQMLMNGHLQSNNEPPTPASAEESPRKRMRKQEFGIDQSQDHVKMEISVVKPITFSSAHWTLPAEPGLHPPLVLEKKSRGRPRMDFRPQFAGLPTPAWNYQMPMEMEIRKTSVLVDLDSPEEKQRKLMKEIEERQRLINEATAAKALKAKAPRVRAPRQPRKKKEPVVKIEQGVTQAQREIKQELVDNQYPPYQPIIYQPIPPAKPPRKPRGPRKKKEVYVEPVEPIDIKPVIIKKEIESPPLMILPPIHPPRRETKASVRANYKPPVVKQEPPDQFDDPPSPIKPTPVKRTRAPRKTAAAAAAAAAAAEAEAIAAAIKATTFKPVIVKEEPEDVDIKPDIKQLGRPPRLPTKAELKKMEPIVPDIKPVVKPVDSKPITVAVQKKTIIKIEPGTETIKQVASKKVITKQPLKLEAKKIVQVKKVVKVKPKKKIKIVKLTKFQELEKSVVKFLARRLKQNITDVETKIAMRKIQETTVQPSIFDLIRNMDDAQLPSTSKSTASAVKLLPMFSTDIKEEPVTSPEAKRPRIYSPTKANGALKYQFDSFNDVVPGAKKFLQLRKLARRRKKIDARRRAIATKMAKKILERNERTLPKLCNSLGIDKIKTSKRKDTYLFKMLQAKILREMDQQLLTVHEAYMKAERNRLARVAARRMRRIEAIVRRRRAQILKRRKCALISKRKKKKKTLKIAKTKVKKEVQLSAAEEDVKDIKPVVVDGVIIKQEVMDEEDVKPPKTCDSSEVPSVMGSLMKKIKAQLEKERQAALTANKSKPRSKTQRTIKKKVIKKKSVTSKAPQKKAVSKQLPNGTSNASQKIVKKLQKPFNSKAKTTVSTTAQKASNSKLSPNSITKKKIPQKKRVIVLKKKPTSVQKKSNVVKQKVNATARKRRRLPYKRNIKLKKPCHTRKELLMQKILNRARRKSNTLVLGNKIAMFKVNSKHRGERYFQQQKVKKQLLEKKRKTAMKEVNVVTLCIRGQAGLKRLSSTIRKTLTKIKPMLRSDIDDYDLPRIDRKKISYVTKFLRGGKMKTVLPSEISEKKMRTPILKSSLKKEGTETMTGRIKRCVRFMLPTDKKPPKRRFKMKTTSGSLYIGTSSRLARFRKVKKQKEIKTEPPTDDENTTESFVTPVYSNILPNGVTIKEELVEESLEYTSMENGISAKKVNNEVKQHLMDGTIPDTSASSDMKRAVKKVVMKAIPAINNKVTVNKLNSKNIPHKDSVIPIIPRKNKFKKSTKLTKYSAKKQQQRLKNATMYVRVFIIKEPKRMKPTKTIHPLIPVVESLRGYESVDGTYCISKKPTESSADFNDQIAIEQLVDDMLSYVAKERKPSQIKEAANRYVARRATHVPLEHSGNQETVKRINFMNAGRKAAARMILTPTFSSVMDDLHRPTIPRPPMVDVMYDHKKTSWWNTVSRQLINRTKKSPSLPKSRRVSMKKKNKMGKKKVVRVKVIKKSNKKISAKKLKKLLGPLPEKSWLLVKSGKKLKIKKLHNKRIVVVKPSKTPKKSLLKTAAKPKIVIKILPKLKKHATLSKKKNSAAKEKKVRNPSKKKNAESQKNKVNLSSIKTAKTLVAKKKKKSEDPSKKTKNAIPAKQKAAKISSKKKKPNGKKSVGSKKIQIKSFTVKGSTKAAAKKNTLTKKTSGSKAPRKKLQLKKKKKAFNRKVHSKKMQKRLLKKRMLNHEHRRIQMKTRKIKKEDLRKKILRQVALKTDPLMNLLNGKLKKTVIITEKGRKKIILAKKMVKRPKMKRILIRIGRRKAPTQKMRKKKRTKTVKTTTKKLKTANLKKKAGLKSKKVKPASQKNLKTAKITAAGLKKRTLKVTVAKATGLKKNKVNVVRAEKKLLKKKGVKPKQVRITRLKKKVKQLNAKTSKIKALKKRVLMRIRMKLQHLKKMGLNMKGLTTDRIRILSWKKNGLKLVRIMRKIPKKKKKKLTRKQLIKEMRLNRLIKKTLALKKKGAKKLGKKKKSFKRRGAQKTMLTKKKQKKVATTKKAIKKKVLKKKKTVVKKPDLKKKVKKDGLKANLKTIVKKKKPVLNAEDKKKSTLTKQNVKKPVLKKKILVIKKTVKNNECAPTATVKIEPPDETSEVVAAPIIAPPAETVITPKQPVVTSKQPVAKSKKPKFPKTTLVVKKNELKYFAPPSNPMDILTKQRIRQILAIVEKNNSKAKFTIKKNSDSKQPKSASKVISTTSTLKTKPVTTKTKTGVTKPLASNAVKKQVKMSKKKLKKKPLPLMGEQLATEASTSNATLVDKPSTSDPSTTTVLDKDKPSSTLPTSDIVESDKPISPSAPTSVAPETKKKIVKKTIVIKKSASNPIAKKKILKLKNSNASSKDSKVTFSKKIIRIYNRKTKTTTKVSSKLFNEMKGITPLQALAKIATPILTKAAVQANAKLAAMKKANIPIPAQKTVMTMPKKKRSLPIKNNKTTDGKKPIVKKVAIKITTKKSVNKKLTTTKLLKKNPEANKTSRKVPTTSKKVSTASNKVPITSKKVSTASKKVSTASKKVPTKKLKKKLTLKKNSKKLKSKKKIVKKLILKKTKKLKSKKIKQIKKRYRSKKFIKKNLKLARRKALLARRRALRRKQLSLRDELTARMGQFDEKVYDQITHERTVLDTFFQVLKDFDRRAYYHVLLDMERDINDNDNEMVREQKKYHRLRTVLMKPPSSIPKDRKLPYGEISGNIIVNPNEYQCNEVLKNLSPYWRGPTTIEHPAVFYVTKAGQRVYHRTEEYVPLKDDHEEFYLDNIKSLINCEHQAKSINNAKELYKRVTNINVPQKSSESTVQQENSGISRRALAFKKKAPTHSNIGAKALILADLPDPSTFENDSTPLEDQTRAKVARFRETMASSFHNIHTTTLLMMQTRDAIRIKVGLVPLGQLYVDPSHPSIIRLR